MQVYGRSYLKSGRRRQKRSNCGTTLRRAAVHHASTSCHRRAAGSSGRCTVRASGTAASVSLRLIEPRPQEPLHCRRTLKPRATESGGTSVWPENSDGQILDAADCNCLKRRAQTRRVRVRNRTPECRRPPIDLGLRSAADPARTDGMQAHAFLRDLPRTPCVQCSARKFVMYFSSRSGLSQRGFA